MNRAASRDPSTSGMAVAMALQRTIIHAVASDSETLALASDAFRSFVRAYATHPKVGDSSSHLPHSGLVGHLL